MARVVVGMSGGVDSSLAAILVQEAGHEVVGITMKLWPCVEMDGGYTRGDVCCSPHETIDARAVAMGAGVRHYVIDLEDEFRRHVVDGFIAAYAAGTTPNPCVRCNEKIKFGSLWEHARRLGASQVATGHYARTARVDGRHCLRTSVDTGKDQTYFLFSLTQEQLAAAWFPVGDLTKDQVRNQARQRHLATADKRESQDICFVAGSLGDFLRQRVPEAFQPGPILHCDGRFLGEHRGIAAYTIGQRKGVGVAWSEPLFVVTIDRTSNTVVLGPRSALMTTTLSLESCTWHLGPLPRDGLSCLVRTRHRGTPIPALVRPQASDPGQATVHFNDAQMRSAAGQACVVYDAHLDLCLGGGWITASH
jgi:tRNA-specific 2-thiouridylase